MIFLPIYSLINILLVGTSLKTVNIFHIGSLLKRFTLMEERKNGNVLYDNSTTCDVQTVLSIRNDVH